MIDKPLKVAIISDMHVGEHAREFDMQPGGKAPYPDYLGYLDYFQKTIEERAISADILIVSGDITHQAQPSQFKHAATVIARIAKLLKVPDGNIIAVPGNHDLNWDIAKLAVEKSEPFWMDFRFAPFQQGATGSGCHPDLVTALIEPPHFYLQEQSDADIWCFNSAAYDLPDQKPHRGEIRELHRAELEKRLQSRYKGKKKEKYRIFVTHHHPKPQPDLYRDIPDFSGMVNGESLLDLLITHQFDIVVHGHKHRPWCRPFLEAGRDPIVVWCSGSFSQTLGNAYYGSIGNLWHLLELQGTSDNGHCFGTIKSWAFAPAQGWLPSRPVHHGIDYLTPFGYLADRASIIQTCQAQINDALSKSSIVKWDELRGKDDLLKFQPGPVVWGILDEIGPTLECRAHGERDSLDGLLILKETL